MVSEKIIVILIVVAIILSIISVVVTMSATMAVPQFQSPKVVYNYAPPKQPDSETAQVGLTITKPIIEEP